MLGIPRRIISLQGIPLSHPNQSPEEIERAKKISDRNAHILDQLLVPARNWVAPYRCTLLLGPNEDRRVWSKEDKELLKSVTLAEGYWSCFVFLLRPRIEALINSLSKVLTEGQIRRV